MKIHKIGLITGINIVGLWIYSAVYLGLFFSAGLAIIQVVLIIIGLFVINISFCRKCPLHKNGCMHFCLGNIARIFKDKSGEEYKTRDTILLYAFFLPVILFPQYWLLKNIIHFVIYWFVLIVSMVLVLKFVCPDCGNTKCPVNIKLNNK